MNINIYDYEKGFMPITVKVSKGFYDYLVNVYHWFGKIPEMQEISIYKEAQHEYYCYLLREKFKKAKNKAEKDLTTNYVNEHNFRYSDRDFFPRFEKEIAELY